MKKRTEVFLYSYPKQKILHRIALVFPERYELGMASLGFQGVYHLLQSYPFLQVERFFYEGSSRPLSVETHRPLEEFDTIMVSISFEVDILHLITMLELSHIPLKRSHRQHPALVVGGIGCSLMGGYLAEMADLIIVTDAEFALPRLVDAMVSHEKEWWAFCSGEGIIHPEEVTSPHLPFVSHPVQQPLHSVILTPENEFPMRGLLEVSRSCRYRCGFCLVSHLYGGYQPFPRDRILEVASLYRHKTDKLGLVAATLTNHPEFEGIIDDLNGMGFELSFSAFRIETLSFELLSKIVANEKKTLVLAPESASDRQKQLINKRIPNDLFLEKIRQATMIGIKRLKLYFLIGLPEETEEDLLAIVHLVREIALLSKEQAKIHGYIPEIIVDINPLVPKPFTALACAPMDTIPSLKKKILFLKQRIHGLGRVFVSGESPRRARLQYDIGWYRLSWEELVHLARTNHSLS